MAARKTRRKVSRQRLQRARGGGDFKPTVFVNPDQGQGTIVIFWGGQRKETRKEAHPGKIVIDLPLGGPPIIT